MLWAMPTGRRLQWVVMGFGILLMTLFYLLEARQETEKEGKPYQMAFAFIAAFTQAAWITLDCRLMGRRVAWWPMGAFLCGPFAIWIYLIVAYRSRALYLIPFSILVYAAAFGLAAVVESLSQAGLPPGPYSAPGTAPGASVAG